jgi:hypothetical protein
MNPFLLRALWLGAVLLSGCATTPLFEADWYMQEEDKQDSLVLALFNRSDQPQTVTGLIVNRSPEGTSDKGWKLVIDPPTPLHPGKLVLLHTKDLIAIEAKTEKKWPDCTLPIGVVVVLKGEAEEKADLPNPHLPNVLPRGWERCLPSPRNDANAASKPRTAVEPTR